MRSIKNWVLTGSLAAASASASLATAIGMPSTSNRMRPGLTRVTRSSGVPCLAHADFDRLLRHRHVRIDADPCPARSLHEAGERAARGLDLARGDALGSSALRPSAGRRRAWRRWWRRQWIRPLKALRNLVRFGCSMAYILLSFQAAVSRRGRPSMPLASSSSCAIGSCSRISPLKIQTLMPQVP